MKCANDDGTSLVGLQGINGLRKVQVTEIMLSMVASRT